MPPSPKRRDSRRDYRHFPAEYTELLDRFDRDGAAAIGPLTHDSARAAARELYRFKMFLSAGCDEDPDDAHCRRLFGILNAATIRVEPVSVGTPEGDHMIVLRLNPIVAAMRRGGD